MAGVDIGLRVDSDELRRALGATAMRARFLGPVWDQVGDIMLKSIAENFRAGGRPPWPPLKDAGTAKGRRRRRVRGQLLDATGALARSIEARPIAGGIAVGSDLPYAQAHQEGTATIPARPFLVVQPEDERAIVKVIEDYLVSPFGRAMA